VFRSNRPRIQSTFRRGPGLSVCAPFWRQSCVSSARALRCIGLHRRVLTAPFRQRTDDHFRAGRDSPARVGGRCDRRARCHVDGLQEPFELASGHFASRWVRSQRNVAEQTALVDHDLRRVAAEVGIFRSIFVPL